MNERIKQLAEQATLIKEVTCEGYRGKPYTRQEQYFDKQKFAELIVQECIQMVETEASQYAEPVWAFELVNDMYEQFEIKQ